MIQISVQVLFDFKEQLFMKQKIFLFLLLFCLCIYLFLHKNKR